jgi:hypothetical protein
MIDFEYKFEWGGSRENGQTKPWVFESNNINSRLFLNKHKETIKRQTIEERILK